MLQSRKKEMAEEKQESRKTGGGQISVTKGQSSFDELLDLKTNTEIQNVKDCDNFEIIYTDEIIDKFTESK